MIKNNNKGFSFSLVIAIMVIASILVASVIVIVSANYNMKQTQKAIDSNKYSAEKGLKDIEEDLQEFCQEKLQIAYQKTLVKYGNNMDSDYINDQFAIIYIKELYDDLSKNDVNEKFEGWLGDISENCTYLGTAEVDSIYAKDDSGDYAKDENGNYLIYPYLTIKDVGVQYTKANSETETIITDLRINAPDLFASNQSFTDVLANRYGSFSLMTDKTVSMVGVNNIDGNIYGGGQTDTDGVYTDGFSLFKSAKGTVNFTSDEIISRGNFTIYDSDKTNKAIINGKNTDKANVYVDNIMTESSGFSTTNFDKKYTVLKTYANLYVRNDTLLNRPYMCVNMNGTYYGFTTGTEDKSKEQSAFNINGRFVNANLSGLSTLLLAGTSYLDIPVTDEDDTYVEIGDSLTGKFSQTVYMIPAKYIVYVTKKDDDITKKCIGNPISDDLYKSCEVICTSTKSIEDTVTDDGDYIVLDYYAFNQEKGIDISEYVNIKNDCGVTRITPVYREQMSIEGGIRTYLYFNFKSKEKASEYLTQFNKKFKKYINHASNSFNYGKVTIGDGSALYTVGNVLLNSGSKVKILANSSTITDSFIVLNENTINKEFCSLASTLLPYSKALVDSYNASCFDYIINESGIEDSTTAYEIVGDTIQSVPKKLGGSITPFVTDGNILIDGKDINFNGETVNILVCDGDVTVPTGTFNGLIVTTGKCKLNKGVVFKGTIMAKEGIECDTNNITNETSSGSILSWLLSNDKYNQQLSEVFNHISFSEKGEIRNAVDIVHKNWMVF